jgi:phage terminase large subunit-like protein
MPEDKLGQNNIVPEVKRSPPIDVPDERDALIKEMYKMHSDFLYFTRNVLGYLTPRHYREWYEFAEQHNRMLIIAQRDAGKSVFASFCYPLWKIYRGDYSEILILGAEANEAQRRLEQIKVEIENNPWLKHLDGSKQETWGKQRLVTNKPHSEALRGVEVSAMGFPSVKRGRHPQLIILDDIMNERSPLSVESVKDIYYSVVVNMLSVNSKLFIVGTPISFDDLYADLKENKQYLVVEYPAYDEKGEPLWKERWSKEALEIRREEIGELKFAREYLCKPLSSKTAIFKEDYINGAKRTTFTLGQKPPDPELVVAGVDFAFSDSQTADYSVITVVGKYGNTLRVIDVWRKKGTSMSEISEELAKLTREYGIEFTIAEDTGQQTAVIKELVSNGHRIIPITTTRYNKNEMISTLVYEFEKRRMAIPARSTHPKTIEYFKTLKRELLTFAVKSGRFVSLGRHDDTVMSLGFAVYYIRKYFNFIDYKPSTTEGVDLENYRKAIIDRDIDETPQQDIDDLKWDDKVTYIDEIQEVW